MSEELHAVTKLLLARMGSHPEEFKDEYIGSDVRPFYGAHRWSAALNMIIEYASEEDKRAINGGLRGIRMAQAHEWVMDELLNGPARREEEQRYKEAAAQTHATMQASLYAQAGQTSDPYSLQNYSSQRSTLGNILKKGLGF